MTSVLAVLVGLAVVGLGVRANAADDTYLIGTGSYDVTGPAAEVEMVRPSMFAGSELG